MLNVLELQLLQVRLQKFVFKSVKKRANCFTLDNQSKMLVNLSRYLLGMLVTINIEQIMNGTYSYLVTPEKVEVWLNGSQIRTDSFNTSYNAGN